jgi:transcriptional regulator with AAA-type ATPase domain
MDARTVPNSTEAPVVEGELARQVTGVVVGDERARLSSYDHLQARLIEHCAFAQHTGAPLAVVQVQLEPAAASASADPAADPAADRILLDLLRPGELAAVYGPGVYTLLLVDGATAGWRARADGIAAALGSQWGGARCGLARYPREGTTPQALLTSACERVRRDHGTEDRSSRVVVVAPAVSDLHQLARRASASPGHVLVKGEIGVGKEILAHTLHRLSRRSDGPFLTLGCALDEPALDAELFGPEPGQGGTPSFGLVDAAEGGTIYLDDIDRMPLRLQAKLLRLIDGRQVLRTARGGARRLDVRFVAGTSLDLPQEVAGERFLSDLLDRFAALTLEIPPLRERLPELELLARFFLQRAADESGESAWSSLSPDAHEALRSYAWPANIRELRNVMERAWALCGGHPVTTRHLPLGRMTAAPWPPRSLPRETLLEALDRCHGIHSRAAELVGLPRDVFCRQLT